MSTPTPFNNTTFSEANDLIQDGANDVPTIVRICFSIILFIVMFGVGCAADFEAGYAHFRRPAGICVGIFCQIIIMPFLALFFVYATQLPDVESMAVLIQGTAPGGMMSNIVTYWIDGDVNLSISMTALTTMLTLGSMPLWLFVFTKILDLREELRIPYNQLGIALGIMVVPVLLGALLKRYKPKIGSNITKIFTAVGTIAIIVTLVVSGVVAKLTFHISWQQWMIATLTPLIGMGIGYCIACIKPFKLNEKCRRTIGIETGMQNCQISQSILVITYATNIAVFEQIRLYPLVSSLFQILWGGIIVASVRLWARRSREYALPVTVTVEESKEYLRTNDLDTVLYE